MSTQNNQQQSNYHIFLVIGTIVILSILALIMYSQYPPQNYQPVKATGQISGKVINITNFGTYKTIELKITENKIITICSDKGDILINKEVVLDYETRVLQHCKYWVK